MSGQDRAGLETGGQQENCSVEYVVLLDEDGTWVGTAKKSRVHTDQTPLHLAFSCYLLDHNGRILLTRRALSKRTWPGVWTNSVCGHPGPEEDIEAAVRRRADFELGVKTSDLRVVLPEFRYRAVDPQGMVEHESCPVFIAIASSTVACNPDEVMDWSWVDPNSLLHAATCAPFAFSPWMVSQLPLLEQAGAFTRGEGGTAWDR